MFTFEVFLCIQIVYNMKERLNELLRHYSISKSNFAQLCGISKATISHITSENGRGGHFSEETIEKILKAFPNVSRDWFVYGNGSMTIADDSLHDGTPSLFSTVNNTNIVKREPVNTSINNDHGKTTEPNTPKTKAIVNDTNSERKNKLYTPNEDISTNKNRDRAEEYAVKYVAIDPKSVEKPIATIERIVIFYSDGTYSQYLPKSTNH